MFGHVPDISFNKLAGPGHIFGAIHVVLFARYEIRNAFAVAKMRNHRFVLLDFATFSQYVIQTCNSVIYHEASLIRGFFYYTML